MTFWVVHAQRRVCCMLYAKQYADVSVHHYINKTKTLEQEIEHLQNGKEITNKEGERKKTL